MTSLHSLARAVLVLNALDIYVSVALPVSV